MRAVNEYTRLAGEAVGILDLQLTMVESGTGFTLRYGDISEPFYEALEMIFADFTSLLKEHASADAATDFDMRLMRLAQNASQIGWGYGDYVRAMVQEIEMSLNRDLYFAIYQNLWAEEQNGRIFEHFPPDFFDLIIMDEAHRSGFGTWKEILDHFGDAIHLGMTATPKQDENVDTYGYFCNVDKAGRPIWYGICVDAQASH